MRPSHLLLPTLALTAILATLTLAAPPTPSIQSTIAKLQSPPSPAHLTLTDLSGTPHTLCNAEGEMGAGGTVLIFLSTECPISNSSVPELNRLAKVAADHHLAFFGVISDSTTTRNEALKHHADFKLAFPNLFDASGTLAAILQPTTTPHAFLLNSAGNTVYSGRIDDAFAAVNKPNAETRHRYLEDAILSLAADKPIATPFVPPVGCIFEGWKRNAKDAAPVTYTRDIAPLLNSNCVSCHREGEVSPFTLTSYKDAAKRSQMLAMVTNSAIMPPWKSTDPLGTFRDQRHLAPSDISLLQQWADAGSPEGDPANLPALPKFPSGWTLGKPDLILKMPNPVNVPAGGKDIIRYFVLPIDIEKDRQVVAFEFHPGNRKVVHHMIAFLDSTGAGRTIAKNRGDGTSYESFGGPGFVPTGGLGGWAPGSQPHFLPDDAGRKLQKASDLVMQIHYHPSGKDESDQSQLALYFAPLDKPAKRLAMDFPLGTRNIDIPPGDADYIRTAQITTPADVTLFGIMPHMHNVAKSMTVTATYKDGSTKTLITVKDWDWNWQEQYQYAIPLKLPAGTKVSLEAHYDNSDKNPHNPNNPPKRIRQGEQTTDEMCLCFLQLTVDGPLGELLLQTNTPRLRRPQQPQ